MGLHYTQLDIVERCEIARLHATGHSLRQIAAALDRSPSTVARELKRNPSANGGYRPKYADQQAHARRWHGHRLTRDPTLREDVLARLELGWSPEQVSGRLALEKGRTVISHESIYRFIYAQIARRKDYSWRLYLPRRKSRRGWRGRRGGSSVSFIPDRLPLEERPQDADDRQKPGHWEADTMLFSAYGQVVLILHERCTRLLIALRPPGKAAGPIATAIAEALGALAPGVAPDGRLRQRHGVRPPPPSPRPRHPDLLLRHPLPLAEGRRGERHWPAAEDPAPQDRPGGGVRGALHPTGPSLQPHPSQVSGLPDPSRNFPEQGVALEM